MIPWHPEEYPKKYRVGKHAPVRNVLTYGCL
jgi:hypothetical protein